MRINGNQVNPALPASSPEAGQPPKPHSGLARGRSDEVRISDLAAQLAADPSKLAQLQAAYQSGLYQVSPSQVANSLIKAHLT
jgi:anti-sigma28 factor (negative regulator of flagellin synthesis)